MKTKMISIPEGNEFQIYVPIVIAAADGVKSAMAEKLEIESVNVRDTLGTEAEIVEFSVSYNYVVISFDNTLSRGRYNVRIIGTYDDKDISFNIHNCFEITTYTNSDTRWQMFTPLVAPTQVAIGEGITQADLSNIKKEIEKLKIEKSSELTIKTKNTSPYVYCDYSVHQRQFINQGSNPFMVVGNGTSPFYYRRAFIELEKNIKFSIIQINEEIFNVRISISEKLWDWLTTECKLESIGIIIKDSDNYRDTDRPFYSLTAFLSQRGMLEIRDDGYANRYYFRFMENIKKRISISEENFSESMRLYFPLLHVIKLFGLNDRKAKAIILRWKKDWWQVENIKTNTEVRFNKNFATINVYRGADISFAPTWRGLKPAPYIKNEDLINISSIKSLEKDGKLVYILARSGHHRSSKYGGIQAVRTAFCYKEPKRKVIYSEQNKQIRIAYFYGKIASKNRYLHKQIILTNRFLRVKHHRPHLISWGREYVVWKIIKDGTEVIRMRPTGRIISPTETYYNTCQGNFNALERLAITKEISNNKRK